MNTILQEYYVVHTCVYPSIQCSACKIGIKGKARRNLDNTQGIAVFNELASAQKCGTVISTNDVLTLLQTAAWTDPNS